MATIKARGQITIVDQNDAISFQAFIGSNLPSTQIYTKDTLSYTPDWSVAPHLILTPQLSISGIGGDAIAGVPGSNPVQKTIKDGSVIWRKDNGAPIVTNADYTVAAAAPYTLTVKKNVNTGGGATQFQFSAILIDPHNGLETPFSTIISFNTVQNSASGLQVVMYAPEGVVFKNDLVASLKVQADLYRGNVVDTTLVSYEWAIRDPGIFAPTNLTAAGTIGASSLTLANAMNIIVGSKLKAGATTYTVTSVNTTTKVVGITPNLVSAVATGGTGTITSPFYDEDLGANWAKISADPYFDGITGFTTNTITVPNAAVLNMETFKCTIKDDDPASPTYNQTSFDMLTLTDWSDPITIDIAAPAGTVIKNGAGNITLIAKVWRAGAEIDTPVDGPNIYDYLWDRFDANGDVDGSFGASVDKQKKKIVITPSDVNGKSTFEVRLMSKD